MSKETPQGASGNRGDRIRVKYGPLDVRATLSDEWRNRKGSVAVCSKSIAVPTRESVLTGNSLFEKGNIISDTRFLG